MIPHRWNPARNDVPARRRSCGIFLCACASVLAAGALRSFAQDAGGNKPALAPTTNPASAPASQREALRTPATGKASATGVAPSVRKLKGLSLEELMDLEVPIVTTASKTAEKATSTPGTTIVITARDIKLRGYSNLTDVLQDLPGFDLAGFYDSEIGTQAAVRGIIGNNKTIFLVNGMRVNPPGGDEMPLRNDFSVRDADQIEIVYGPGSTLYGQDAISGVVNVKTKKPTGDFSGEIGADYGLRNEREAWGTFGGFLDKSHTISLSGYVQYHDSDLTPIDTEYPRYWADFLANAKPNGAGRTPEREDFGLNAFARLEVGNTSFQIWHRESERSASEGILPAFEFVNESRFRDRSTVAELRNVTPIANGAAVLESSLAYNRFEVDPRSTFVFANPARRFFDDKYGSSAGLTLEETVRAELTEKLALLAGFQAGTFDVIPLATFPTRARPGGNPFTPDSDLIQNAGRFVYSANGDDGVFESSVPRATEVRYQTYAGYIEGVYKATDSLKMVGGLRLTDDTRFSGLEFTPRAALIYDVSPEWTVRYTYARAYIAPAPYFAFRTFQNSTVLVETNPKLGPETAESHEVNISFAKKNLSLGLSGFYGMQDGLIESQIRGANGRTILPLIFVPPGKGNTRRLVQAANAGESHNVGADLYGRATFGTLSPWFSYSFVDFEEKSNGIVSGLPALSAHNARAGVTWAATPKLFITPSLVVRSTPQNIDSSRFGGQIDNPYSLNLYILYTVDAHLELFTELRNITDNHYGLGGSRAAGPGQPVRAIPQETFSGVIGVRYSY